MLNVALTGNIAAGKSTVVDLFRKWGATIIDADALVREAQAPAARSSRRLRDDSAQTCWRPTARSTARRCAARSWATTWR